MSDRFTSLKDALTEISRLQGLESQFTTLRGQIPGGDINAHLSEFARRGDEEGRLTRELSAVTTRATTAEADVLRLTGELNTARAAAPSATAVTELAENRAAEIVSSMGVPPAPAETVTSAAVSEPADFASFSAEYRRLQGEDSGKAAGYYKSWGKKFGF